MNRASADHQSGSRAVSQISAELLEVRCVARWRDKNDREYTVLGEPGASFEALERWLVEHHGADVASVERLAGPDPVSPATASDADKACRTATPDELSNYDPVTIKPVDVFAVLHVEPAPRHVTRAEYLAKRASTSAGGSVASSSASILRTSE